jgi:hypothetical protein
MGHEGKHGEDGRGEDRWEEPASPAKGREECHGPTFGSAGRRRRCRKVRVRAQDRPRPPAVSSRTRRARPRRRGRAGASPRPTG